jgi:hypothetical protein
VLALSPDRRTAGIAEYGKVAYIGDLSLAMLP